MIFIVMHGEYLLLTGMYVMDSGYLLCVKLIGTVGRTGAVQFRNSISEFWAVMEP